MLSNNNCWSGSKGSGRGNGMGGGNGMRLRDGSCQGQGAGRGNRTGLSQNAAGRGFFTRFFQSENPISRTSTTSATEELLSAIKDLQQQINDLKGQSGK